MPTADKSENMRVFWHAHVAAPKEALEMCPKTTQSPSTEESTLSSNKMGQARRLTRLKKEEELFPSIKPSIS